MKMFCPDCDKEVEADSFEQVENGEASFNGIGQHTHCPECGLVLTIENEANK